MYCGSIRRWGLNSQGFIFSLRFNLNRRRTILFNDLEARGRFCASSFLSAWIELGEVMFDDFCIFRDGFFFKFSLLIIVVRLNIVGSFFNLSVETHLPLLPFVVNILEAINFLLLIKVFLSLEHLSKDLITRKEVILNPILDRIQYQWEKNHHKNQFKVWFPFEVCKAYFSKPCKKVRKIQLHSKYHEFDK